MEDVASGGGNPESLNFEEGQAPDLSQACFQSKGA